ncbi:MAG: glycerophosphodiester phosphodiesterase [Bacteroidales bacterium]|nr:glycerophosphodiester phosphodiesterase [Bacteroidales bacterium]
MIRFHAISVLAAALVVAACGHNKDAKIDLQAHRGGAGLMPENTISAMKNAIDLKKINTLEFDLQLSQDGKVVVSHDNYFHPRYSTRPDGTLIQPDDPKEYLYTMPYDSITKYDVGLRYVERWPGQAKIAEVKPLASELIDFAENYAAQMHHAPLGYNIEIKSRTGEGEGTLWPHFTEFCDKCMEVLLSKNLGGRLIVQSFDTRALEYVHEKWPDVILSYLTEDETDIETILTQISFKPQWWSPNFEVVTPENVAYCHERGIKVVPWTVDDPEDIRRMADCGSDAIISNYPDRLISVLR